MEAAGLGIGLFALAGQVLELSQGIRDKIETYKSAAAEIDESLGSIKLILRMCCLMEENKDYPQGHPVIQLLEDALKQCLTSVVKIDEELRQIIASGKGYVQSAKWLWNKPKVDKMLGKLNSSLHTLHMVVSHSIALKPQAHTIFLYTDTSTYNTYNAASKVGACVEAYDIVEEPLAKPTIVSVPPRPPKVTRKWNTTTTNALIKYSSSGVSKLRDGVESHHQSYGVGLPWLGFRLNVTARQSALSPLRITLEVPRFIYEEQDKGLFRQIVSDLHPGQIRSNEFGKWLQTNNITARTQLVTRGRKGFCDGVQCSVLGLVVGCDSTEFFRYLLEQGGSPMEDEQHFHELMINTYRAIECGRHVEHTVHSYTRTRSPLMTGAEWSEIIRLNDTPCFLESLLDTWQENCLDYSLEIVDLTFVAVASIFAGWERPSRLPEDLDFSSLIIKLLNLGLHFSGDFDFSSGAVLHRFCEPVQLQSLRFASKPALQVIIMAREDRRPEDVLHMAKQWLLCLEKASISIDQYLKTELNSVIRHLDLCPLSSMPKNWDKVWQAEKLEFVFDLLRPGERFFMEQETSADLHKAMPAFRYLNSAACSPKPGCRNPSHLDWKIGRLTDDSHDFEYIEWPLLKSMPSAGDPERQCLIDEGCWTEQQLIGYDNFVRFFESRAERRQLRKWRKLKKKKASEVDDALSWWEYRGQW